MNWRRHRLRTAFRCRRLIQLRRPNARPKRLCLPLRTSARAAQQFPERIDGVAASGAKQTIRSLNLEDSMLKLRTLTLAIAVCFGLCATAHAETKIKIGHTGVIEALVYV